MSSRTRVQLVAPTVWTTVQLTLHADGSVEPGLAGATPFPRHWLYDGDGNLVQKSGTIDFEAWYDRPAGIRGTPWGDEDSAVFVAMAESSLERELSSALMRRGRPKISVLDAGEDLTRQGEPGDELHLVLDGILSVDVDGRELAELGPGAVVGERAILEGGTRTATLRAVTKVKVATVPADAVDRHALEALTTLHRHEDG
ncbi:MAG TPA: cyclic nucleotide-binding domain-containing protein [Acidimicrobiales bacterium]|nr:cyclic nucleotide-binding domain-containing protein [Acidimicrobiales bacterium]